MWDVQKKESRVDTDAARFDVVRGYCPSSGRGFSCDIKLSCVTWTDSAASASNFADGPGRMNFNRLKGMCSERQDHNGVPHLT